MFDAKLKPLIDPSLVQLGKICLRFGLNANTLTAIGFGFGFWFGPTSNQTRTFTYRLRFYRKPHITRHPPIRTYRSLLPTPTSWHVRYKGIAKEGICKTLGAALAVNDIAEQEGITVRVGFG